ncbi:hypothetical protein Tcan_13590 [Toxocara canis]|uniref:Apple domain-containing protein n=1 Tax=Toxocara canis TaxID=6265 RepID=A0A0B2W1F4_TOXCA|nr:hypothetical protein Tcan_13590 [Toxocara canis]
MSAWTQLRTVIYMAHALVLLATAEGCTQISYIIESERLVEGGVIEKFYSSSIQKCIEQCIKTARCTATNFLLDMELQPVCLLIDTKAPIVAAELPVPESVMYSAVPFCLDSQSSRCGKMSWSFEKYSNQAPLSADYMDIVDGVQQLDDCLSQCAQRLRVVSLLAILWRAAGSRAIPLSYCAAVTAYNRFSSPMQLTTMIKTEGGQPAGDPLASSREQGYTAELLRRRYCL